MKKKTAELANLHAKNIIGRENYFVDSKFKKFNNLF